MEFDTESPEYSFGRCTYVNNSPYKYTDPTGMCPMCIGTLIGAGMSIVTQVKSGMSNGHTLSASVKNISLGKVAGSAALGAVGGVGVQAAKAGMTGTAIWLGTQSKLKAQLFERR